MGRHWAALTRDGKVYCWGQSNHGQLGNGVKGGNCKKPTVVKRLVDENVTVLEIGCGRRFTCALDRDGKLWVFGHNANGQLGLGSAEKVGTPTPLPGYRVRLFACGVTHLLFVDVDGKLYGCGDNRHQQFGFSDVKNCTIPVHLPWFGGRIDAIQCGDSVSFFLSEAKVYRGGRRWGQADRDPRPIEFEEVTAIKGHVVQLKCGRRVTLALTGDGKVWQWGDASFLSMKSTPTLVTVDNVASIFATWDRQFLITKDDQTFASGRNNQGELGIPQTDSPVTPWARSSFDLSTNEITVPWYTSSEEKLLRLAASLENWNYELPNEEGEDEIQALRDDIDQLKEQLESKLQDLHDRSVRRLEQMALTLKVQQRQTLRLEDFSAEEMQIVWKHLDVDRPSLNGVTGEEVKGWSVQEWLSRGLSIEESRKVIEFILFLL